LQDGSEQAASANPQQKSTAKPETQQQSIPSSVHPRQHTLSKQSFIHEPQLLGDSVLYLGETFVPYQKGSSDFFFAFPFFIYLFILPLFFESVSISIAFYFLMREARAVGSHTSSMSCFAKVSNSTHVSSNSAN
jgi:hypothetical protein